MHGPVVAERRGAADCNEVAALDRPKLFEQFWQMGLAKNLGEWEAAMRMQQLPLFNTAYADRDGHIAYVYNATLVGSIPPATTASGRAWCRATSRTSSPPTIVPYDEIPKVIDPPDGLGAELERHAVDVDVSDDARLARSSPPASPRRRASRSARSAASASSARRPPKMTFEDVKRGKLSTRVETADQFVDEIVATAKASGTERAKRAADVLAKWDRQAEVDSDGTLLFYKFMTAAGPNFATSAASRCPTDDARPLDTPRGFKDPAKAMAMLDTVAGEVEKEYGALTVKWGDVLRFRRGNADVPGNGAPSQLGAIRTIGVEPVQERQGRGRVGRHLLRRDRVLDAAARRSAAQLRQLVEDGVEAHRRPAAARLAEGDAPGLAHQGGDRGEPGEPQGAGRALRHVAVS